MSYLVSLSLPVEVDWSGSEFERGEVVKALSARFQNVVVFDGDPLKEQLKKYKARLSTLPGDDASRQRVLHSAEERVRRDSPAFSFQILTKDGLVLEGLAKSWSITITAETSPPASLHTELLLALKSIGRGELLVEGMSL